MSIIDDVEARRVAALIGPQGYDRPVPLAGYAGGPVRPRLVGVVGPELHQAVRAKVAFDVARHEAIVAQQLKGVGRRVAYADVRNPQRFPRTVDLDLQMREAIAGADIGWPSVPGRVPPAGWDGEPGAHNPFREI